MVRLIYGFGVNDSKDNVYSYVDGEQSVCPFYAKWTAMLSRCYSPRFHKSSPHYIGCSVSNEWRLFSAFKSWMQTQDWHGKDLDKDLLYPGNTLYSPDKCCFISRKVNSFINKGSLGKGASMPGTYFHKPSGKFQAVCGNPITLRKESAGYYHSELDAHIAWKNLKHKLACQLAELQTDKRVAEALRLRYAA